MYMLNVIYKSKKKQNAKIKSQKKYGGEPILTIDTKALGDYDNLEPSLSSSSLKIAKTIGFPVMNQSDFILKASLSDTFESVLTGNKSGLAAIAVGTLGAASTLTITFIFTAALFITYKFYITLRNNSYAYRNALVVVYEFYETLLRLNNLLEYIEEVSKSLVPPLQLDSAEIYQDIKYIFQVMDLITTTTMFKTININAATGLRYNLEGDSDDTFPIPEKPGLGDSVKSKIKSWSFNENTWMNKMNSAVGRFNTHMIMLITEWKIISDTRSPHINEEMLEHRKKLKPLQCMIRRIILAPLIRVRNIMYACALSSQTELCLTHANTDIPIKYEISKFKENMKLLWKKIKDGGTADFRKLLSLLQIEINKIRENPDYKSEDYIESNVKEFINRLDNDIMSILQKVNEDITLIEYQSIFKSVEGIYNYAQNCNLTSSLNESINDLNTHRRYKVAAENTVQKMVIIGKAEKEMAHKLILKYTYIHSLLIYHFQKVDVIIHITNQPETGVALLDIPYNSHYIPQSLTKYYMYLQQIISEYNKIHEKIIKLLHDINDDDTVSNEIKNKIEKAGYHTHEKLFIFQLHDTNLSQAINDINELNSKRPKDDKILQDISDSKNKIKTITDKIQTDINKFINTDYDNIKTLFNSIVTIKLKKNISITNGIIIDNQNITKEIESINMIIKNGKNDLYNEQFIKILESVIWIFLFIKNILDNNENTSSIYNGNDLAKYFLFIHLVNNDILYFKDEETYNIINSQIEGFFIQIKSTYLDIDYDSAVQKKQNQYINFLKGFLCSIHEVRIFEKIKQLIDVDADFISDCGKLKDSQSSAFNSQYRLSEYGGGKKSRIKKYNKKKTIKNNKKTKKEQKCNYNYYK